MRFLVTQLFVDLYVFKHQLVSVKLDAIATGNLRIFFTESHQCFSDSFSLVPGQYGDVVQKQFCAFPAQYQYTLYLFILFQHKNAEISDNLPIVIEHRGRLFTDSWDVR